jgi:putative DNA primase/helicase
MNSFLDIALGCLARGWYVFPCAPRDKRPITPNGFKDATADEATVRAWWTRTPDANVGIATGASGLTVLDCDHGIADGAALEAWQATNGLPETYCVRTGRRPEFGVQLYYEGAGIKSVPWEDREQSGDIRGATGYVLAAGSVHPSGERYETLTDAPIASVPEYVRNLRAPERIERVLTTHEPITEWRNDAMARILGKARDGGLSDELLRAHALEVNETRMRPPLDEDELERIIGNACKWAVGELEPQAVIGKTRAPESPPEPIDWRTRYMTEVAYLNVKPPEFLIDGFLVKKSIAMLAGPVAQRKSILALNIAHALCTGEALFGYFDVPGGHERVVYLCPEMGAASFVKRIKQIGLGEYVGKTLFIQTMSEKPTALDELDGELPGAVVIVDTITRFIEGNENESADMRKFAQKVFRLMNAGATVVLLHHSKKGSSGSLDDGLRGSSELAAFVDSCWVTELEDPKKPYESLSKMRNVKQRDFESNPFKLQPAPGSFYLTITGEPEPEAVLNSKADDAATEALRKLLAGNPKMGINKLRTALRAAGHGKRQDWVVMTRATLLERGVTLSQEAIPHTPYP